MFRKQDFVFYIPMNGNATDYGPNSYTTTINGAVLTTNEAGTSNKAYDFDGVNDSITMGASAYDAFFDACNAGSVSLYINMLFNPSASGNNWCAFSANYGTDYTNYYNIVEFYNGGGGADYTIIVLGGGGAIVKNIHSTEDVVIGSWKKMIYESTYATTKYTGRIIKDGAALSLTKSDTDQLIGKSVNAGRILNIGWRQDSPANKAFKGKMNNVFAIKKVLTATERSYISQFGNYKRLA